MLNSNNLLLFLYLTLGSMIGTCFLWDYLEIKFRFIFKLKLEVKNYRIEQAIPTNAMNTLENQRSLQRVAIDIAIDKYR